MIRALLILALVAPIALKLAGLIASWWWAFAPVGLLAAILLLAAAFLVIVAWNMPDVEEYL